VEIESDCSIDGEVKYTNEIRMGDHVSLAKQPEKVASLPQEIPLA
jgi:UDP-3-O-[3-hydroxymyristoyl] glucosamine N-acyltransferase